MKIQIGYTGKKYTENFDQIFNKLKRVCMDCNKVIGYKVSQYEAVTHGLCEKCLEKRNKKLDAQEQINELRGEWDKNELEKGEK